jgi:DNA-binding CsgD family transcriptional regulator
LLFSQVVWWSAREATGLFYVLMHYILCDSLYLVGRGEPVISIIKGEEMEHWSAILDEVVNKKRASWGIEDVAREGKKTHKPMASKVPRKHFKIGPQFGESYFTFREAQCMAQLMRGKTIKATALFLGLSPRTVEYYLKNMKSKLKCRTKSELMQLISDSDFMRYVKDM